MFDNAESVFINNKEVKSIDIVGGGNLYTKPNQHYILHIEYLSENINMSNGCYITVKGENNTTLSSFMFTTALTEIVFDGATILPRDSRPLPELFKSDVTSITASFNPNYGVATVNSVNSISIDSLYQMNVVYDTGVSGISGYIKIYNKDNSSTLLGQQYFGSSGTVTISGVKSSDVVNSSQIIVSLSNGGAPGGLVSAKKYSASVNGNTVTITVRDNYPIYIVFRDYTQNAHATITAYDSNNNIITTIYSPPNQSNNAKTITVYIDIDDASDLDYITANTDSSTYTATVNNNTVTIDRQRETLDGRIIWVDDDNMHNVRPSTVTVELYLNNEKYTEKSITVVSSNQQFSFDNVPSGYSSYTVQLSEDISSDYVLNISGTTIRASLIDRQPKQYQNITGNIVWVGDSSSVRPSSVYVRLYRDGTEVDSRRVTAGTDWQFTFQQIPVDDGYGYTYTYTITNDGVPSYFTSVSTENGVTTITETYIGGNVPDTPDIPDTPPDGPDVPSPPEDRPEKP